MRFLADQDVYRVTVEFLLKNGHDVLTARDIGMQRASDTELLMKAKETGRIFITRDKDFGTLVFLKNEFSSGVIFLRVLPANVNDVHRQLLRLLAENSEAKLNSTFCVIEPGRYRIRRIVG